MELVIEVRRKASLPPKSPEEEAEALAAFVAVRKKRAERFNQEYTATPTLIDVFPGEYERVKIYKKDDEGYTSFRADTAASAPDQLEARKQEFGTTTSSTGEEGVVVDPFADMMDVDEKEVANKLVPPEDAEVEIRPDTLFLFGTQDMSTADIFRFFGSHSPMSLVWLDDHSCNAVFADASKARTALFALSEKIEGAEGTRFEFFRKALSLTKTSLMLRFANALDRKPSSMKRKRSEFYSKYGRLDAAGEKSNKKRRVDPLQVGRVAIPLPGVQKNEEIERPVSYTETSAEYAAAKVEEVFDVERKIEFSSGFAKVGGMRMDISEEEEEVEEQPEKQEKAVIPTFRILIENDLFGTTNENEEEKEDSAQIQETRTPEKTPSTTASSTTTLPSTTTATTSSTTTTATAEPAPANSTSASSETREAEQEQEQEQELEQEQEQEQELEFDMS
eukprot:TRINITY_DN10862_c0_g1_i1.p1 TRINITY_DN10862_c0_g1~~TRINITY_DN10862_c0_g1_i1.p1  ORF type:complete len:469 (-),score=114.32 TRINITY_DN10862_c0_g1_i1:192-1538(-)